MQIGMGRVKTGIREERNRAVGKNRVKVTLGRMQEAETGVKQA
jgi:hypothetical protein